MSGTFNKSHTGFSLLEMVVVITILGIMAISIVPRLTSKKATISTFVEQLNMLNQKAYNNAASTGKLHRIVFDIKNDSIYAEQEAGKKTTGEKVFQQLEQTYAPTITTPKTISLENFMIDGSDELAIGDPKRVWFFIVPNGLTQNITIGLQTEAEDSSSPIQRYRLNPFSAQFRYKEAS